MSVVENDGSNILRNKAHRKFSVDQTTMEMMDIFLEKDDDNDDEPFIDINNSEFKDILKPLDFNGDGKLSKSEASK
jgi:hypothetical protein